MNINSNSFIHKTALVDKGAKIGSNTNIWHWVHICSGAIIGQNCSFGQNVFVGNKVVIGNNVRVQNNVSIYDNVFLEDFVFCGPSMVFTNVYNPRSAFPRKTELKKTIAKKGVTFGANSTIICGNTIGEYAFIAAGAVVNSDVKPYSLMAGVPAKQIGWMSIYGEQIELPLKGKGLWKCKHTGHNYELDGSEILVH